ncbi:MAG: hypothetical protein IT317_09535 [Anaerolineales bacterium]|nr:hypothetical protein [Anaerolineales bacterium]
MPDTPPEPTAAEPAALSPVEPALPADLAAAFDAAGAAETASAEPAPETTAAPSADAQPVLLEPSAAVEAAETAAAPSAVAVAGAGSGAAVAAGRGSAPAVAGGLQLSENVGPATQVFKRAPQLKADKALVKLLIPEARLTALWEEIAGLEAEAAQLQRGSQLLVTEMIDRLATARNMLLHSRDEYENALREVVYVRYRLTRIRHSSLLEQPQTILVYLILILLSLIAAFVATPRLVAGLGTPTPAVAGIEAVALFNTAFWGALGGLAAAFFALQRHVEDFDQQHARWYYLSPLVGLFVGPLMGLVAGLGIPALFQLVNDQPANMQIRPALLYLLAWTVGYQQNLLLELIRSVLKRILPEPPPAAPKADLPSG